MRWLFGLLAFALIFVQTTAAAAPARFAEIDAYLERELQGLKIPGAALAIVKGAEVVHFQSFGTADATGRPVTPQTPFFIGSATKSMTAAAVMQLVEQGRVDLDKPVTTYLPSLQLGTGQITVRHLLNQTSGISTLAGLGHLAGGPSLTLAERAATYQNFPLASEPGRTFRYSNANYNLLGLLVEQVSGQPYPAYMQKHLFEPLGMTHTYVSLPDAQQSGLAQGHRMILTRPVPMAPQLPADGLPSGFVIATAEDMARYLIAQLNGAGTAGLSPDAVAAMHRNAVASEPGYGMGWYVEKQTGRTFHSGITADFWADMELDPATGWGVVLLTNASSSLINEPLKAVGRNLITLLNGGTVTDAAPSFHKLVRIYYAILAVLAALMALILWGLARLRRKVRPAAGSVVGRLGVPSLLLIGLGFLVWLGVPATQGPWGTAFAFEPVLAWALVGLAAFGFLGGLGHAWLGVRAVRARRGAPGKAA